MTTVSQDLTGSQKYFLQPFSQPLFCVRTSSNQSTGRASLSSPSLLHRHHGTYQPSPRSHQHRLFHSFQRHRLPQCRQCASIICRAYRAHSPSPTSKRTHTVRAVENGPLGGTGQRCWSRVCYRRLLLLLLAGDCQGHCSGYELGVFGLGVRYVVLCVLVPGACTEVLLWTYSGHRLRMKAARS